MKKLLFVIAITSIVNSSQGQDPNFTQYLSAPLYLNPAFAGYDGCSRIATTYRNEWPSLNEQFVTYNVSYDQHINKFGGIGINFQHDNAGQGTLYTTSAGISFAPTIRLFDKQLVISPAVDLGWRRKYLNWDKLVFGRYIFDRLGNTLVPVVGNPPNANNHFDLNAGILIAHHNFVYGAAFHHITQPDEGLGRKSILPIKYTGHLTYVHEFSDDFKLSPTIILQGQQDFRLFVIGVAGDYKGYKLGLAMRDKDSFILQAGINRQWLTIGYSYDVTTSKLKIQNTNGSHEVHLSARLNCKDADEKRKGVELIGF